MMKRKKFITTAALGLPALSLASALRVSGREVRKLPSGPVVVSTWNFAGANETAYESLTAGQSPLDAIEAGIMVTEADRSNTSVGIGGYPDRDGHLTLDASIMSGTGECGAVVFMEGIAHPISVARAVMEKTPHVLLAGDGATQFAREEGFPYSIQLTEQAKKAYEDWVRAGGYKQKGIGREIGRENHDTIGMLAMIGGSMAGGCSTSGAAWKMHGRVGDSPIVGAGLFVDDRVGAATSTGLGETVIRIAGAATVVELMRQGATPGEACRVAVERIMEKQPQYGDQQGFLVAFLALSREGDIGAWACGPGFEYVVMRGGERQIIKSEYHTFAQDKVK